MLKGRKWRRSTARSRFPEQPRVFRSRIGSASYDAWLIHMAETPKSGRPWARNVLAGLLSLSMLICVGSGAQTAEPTPPAPVNKNSPEMATRDATPKSGFDVKPGSYFVRIVVGDAEGQKMAALNGAVEIP